MSTSTGSRVGRSPAGNDCAPVLSHSPRGTSGKLHGRAGVRDVSLPENPFPRHRLLGSSWLTEADSMGNQCESDVGHSGTWPWVPTSGSNWLEGSASGPPRWGWEVGVLVLGSGHG